jgi:hypothetical protein
MMRLIGERDMSLHAPLQTYGVFHPIDLSQSSIDSKFGAFQAYIATEHNALAKVLKAMTSSFPLYLESYAV